MMQEMIWPQVTPVKINIKHDTAVLIFSPYLLYSKPGEPPPNHAHGQGPTLVDSHYGGGQVRAAGCTGHHIVPLYSTALINKG